MSILYSGTEFFAPMKIIVWSSTQQLSCPFVSEAKNRHFAPGDDTFHGLRGQPCCANRTSVWNCSIASLRKELELLSHGGHSPVEVTYRRSTTTTEAWNKSGSLLVAMQRLVQVTPRPFYNLWIFIHESKSWKYSQYSLWLVLSQQEIRPPPEIDMLWTLPILRCFKNHRLEISDWIKARIKIVVLGQHLIHKLWQHSLNQFSPVPFHYPTIPTTWPSLRMWGRTYRLWSLFAKPGFSPRFWKPMLGNVVYSNQIVWWTWVTRISHWCHYVESRSYLSDGGFFHPPDHPDVFRYLHGVI